MDRLDALDELPPLPESVAKVLDQLADHQPMTGKQIREATGLPRRTIYTALRRLRELGVLHEQLNLRDARQTYFWLDQDDMDQLHPPHQSHHGQGHAHH